MYYYMIIVYFGTELPVILDEKSVYLYIIKAR